jgi:hypothetical protein
MEWQTLTAAGIVVLTLTIFLVRLARRPRGNSGCDHGCGCEKNSRKSL